MKSALARSLSQHLIYCATSLYLSVLIQTMRIKPLSQLLDVQKIIKRDNKGEACRKIAWAMKWRSDFDPAEPMPCGAKGEGSVPRLHLEGLCLVASSLSSLCLFSLLQKMGMIGIITATVSQHCCGSDIKWQVHNKLLLLLLWLLLLETMRTT